MTQLTAHFSLAEMTVTEVRGVSNEPSERIIETLKETSRRMEFIRELLDHPIVVTSGYRSALVNKIIGGASFSAHMKGQAVDFICPGFGSPLSVCHAIADARNEIEFDQLIQEGTWTHISFAPEMRGEVLTKNVGGGYVVGLMKLK